MKPGKAKPVLKANPSKKPPCCVNAISNGSSKPPQMGGKGKVALKLKAEAPKEKIMSEKKRKIKELANAVKNCGGLAIYSPQSKKPKKDGTASLFTMYRKRNQSRDCYPKNRNKILCQLCNRQRRNGQTVGIF